MHKLLETLTCFAIGFAAYLFVHVGLWAYLNPAYAGSGFSVGRALIAFQLGLLAAYLPFMPLIPVYVCRKKEPRKAPVVSASS